MSARARPARNRSQVPVPMDAMATMYVMLEQLGYPLQWLQSRTEFVFQDDTGIAFSLRNALGDAFAIVLLTTSAEAASMAAAAAVLRNILQGSETSSVGLVTDGMMRGSQAFTKRASTGELDAIPRFPRCQSLWTTTAPSKTRAMSQRDIDVFFKCHCVLRDVDGLHADECLDELCKLLYTKIWAELERTDDSSTFWLEGINLEEAASLIRSLYTRARMDMPDWLGSKGVFGVPLRLSSAAIVEVVRLLQKLTFSLSSADIKGIAFQRVIDAAMRGGMGQYFTPAPVVQMSVEMLDPSPDDLVLDPFCGSGRFLHETVVHVARKPRSTIGDPRLHGIEKSDRMVRIALTDALLHEGERAIQIWCKDSLLSMENYDEIVPGKAPAGTFDIVMTNPPFGSLLSRGALQRLGRFELAKGRANVPLEVIGLERSLQFLRVGGRLAIVVPESILTTRQMQFVRQWIFRHSRVVAVVSLPPQTFKVFDGVTKASVILLEKLDMRGGEATELGYQVFTARAEHVGYDATNRPDPKNDLPAIAQAFRQWQERGEVAATHDCAVRPAASLATKMSAAATLPMRTQAGWQYVPLGELAEAIFTGTTPPRSGYSHAGYRILKVRDLTNEGINWDAEERAFVDEDFFGRHQDRAVQLHDLLFTASAHHPVYIGKKVDIIDQIPPKYEAGVLIVHELMGIRMKRELVDPLYILLYLRSDEGYRALQSCVVGQTAHIYARDVSNIMVPVPDRTRMVYFEEALAVLRESLELRALFKERVHKAHCLFSARIQS